jgi:hypothetical protein
MYNLLTSPADGSIQHLRNRLFSLKQIGLKWLLISLLIYPPVFTISVAIDSALFGNSLPEAEQLSVMTAGIITFVGNTFIIPVLGPIALTSATKLAH